MISTKDWIKSHEGFSSKIYKCTAGANTIGYGRNLDDGGITQAEADFMLDNDIAKCKSQLEKFTWYTRQPPDVQSALVNMCFNLGITRLLQFKKMIAALEVHKYNIAATEALDSAWAKQVPNRAKEIIAVLREGR